MAGPSRNPCMPMAELGGLSTVTVRLEFRFLDFVHLSLIEMIVISWRKPVYLVTLDVSVVSARGKRSGLMKMVIRRTFLHAFRREILLLRLANRFTKGGGSR